MFVTSLVEKHGDFMDTRAVWLPSRQHMNMHLLATLEISISTDHSQSSLHAVENAEKLPQALASLDGERPTTHNFRNITSFDCFESP